MSIIKDYLAWAKQYTNAWDRYLEYCALFLISQSLSSRVYMPYAGRRLYPNMMLCLAGPARISYKSTCLNLARQVMEYIDPLLIFNEQQNWEHLISSLEKRPQGSFWIDNLRVWPVISSQKFIDIIKKIYDSPDHLSCQFQKEEFILINPCLGIITAMRSEELVNLTQKQREFVSRFMIVANRRKPSWKEFQSFFDTPDPASLSAISAPFRQLKSASGVIRLSDEAKIYYNDYFQKFFASNTSQSDRYNFTSFDEFPVYALKIAMCLSFNEGAPPDEYVISQAKMQESLEWIRDANDRLSDMLYWKQK